MSRFIVLKQDGTREIQIPYEDGWDLKTVEGVCAAIDKQLDVTHIVLGHGAHTTKLEVFPVEDLPTEPVESSGPDGNDRTCIGCDVDYNFKSPNAVGMFCSVSCKDEYELGDRNREDDEVFTTEEVSRSSTECDGCGESVGCICMDRT